MMQVLNSLDTVSTGYCVFEKDQILTHTHLNDLAGYFDDQDRLTRITLLGVGIPFGLNVSVRAGKVFITKGMGVTSDGDLLRLTEDVSFDAFKARGADAPLYLPLTMVKTQCFELTSTSSGGTSLASFTASTGLALTNMLAVLLMESYVKDEDACSGTDCDNKGQNATHTPKVLLVEKSALSGLKETFSTMEAAAKALEPAYAERATLTSTDRTAAAIAAAYLTASSNTASSLTTRLGKVYPACSSFLTGVFTTDPSTTWKKAIDALTLAFTKSSAGVQYYYDFLKDLVAVYNALREALYGDTFVCCPPPSAFPKHLLLGQLNGLATASVRTGYYPSPAVSPSVERWKRVRALAKTIDTLIKTFKVPTSGAITVTPSAFEDRPLEERAIPWYYQATSTAIPHRDWNATATQRGLERYLYSYHAPSAGRLGASAEPLKAQIAPFPFFRVEGCLGAAVEDAIDELESIIAASNLPFDVRAVALSSRTADLKATPLRYGDLHRIHQVLRTDLAAQLDTVKSFSSSLGSKITKAVDAGAVDEDDETTNEAIKTTAESVSGAAVTKASAAKSKVATSFSSFSKDSSWTSAVTDAVDAASSFKSSLGSNLRTDFPSPLDSIVSSSTGNLLGWLGEVIADRDEKANEALLFENFIAAHPGAEHAAGVLRGGTFVLLYDTDGKVVADVTLPYQWPDEETESTEPTLSAAAIRPTMSASSTTPTSTVTSTVATNLSKSATASTKLTTTFRSLLG